MVTTTDRRLRNHAVPAENLRWRCDPSQFAFVCTSEIEPLAQFIGQERALRAIEFGLAMDRPGYNIFVTGLAGTGKTSVIKSYLQKVVSEKAPDPTGNRPADLCYVYNFVDPDRPLCLHLPRGKGKQLRAGMDDLVRSLRRELAQALAGEEHEARRKQILDQGQIQQRQIFQQLERRMHAEGFLLQTSQQGIGLLPLAQAKPMTQEEYLALPAEEREALETKQSELLREVQATFEEVQVLERQTAELIRNLDEQVVAFAIAGPFNELRTQFQDLPEVVFFIDAVRTYTLANVDLFRSGEGAASAAPRMPSAPPVGDPYLAYRVNLLVDNADNASPPVVIESNPTWGNLFGKIERRAVMGAYFSDHTMLKAGALSLANGGYLVVNARDVLANPVVWEGLKRALRNREVRLEDPQEQFGLLAPQGLRPLPMSLDAKVIVTGDGVMHQALTQYDEDFWEIFKVRADFDFQVERTPEHIQAYAGFICTTCQLDGLRPFERTGVARLVEEAARLVADQDRLSARFGVLRDILIEADYWAQQDGATMVLAGHVSRAVEEKVFRSGLVAERLRSLIADGTIMVQTQGAVVGQVNGLAVYELGEYSFGRPSRITARTFMGRAGVINIEREAQLSGRTHDKGVLILSGYLGARFAYDVPLSMSASVCFEQSYEGIDGDSASSTELYAILSSLADVPLQQGIAVTGSVNQQGEIQPIGGVNQKIEGYFDVCRSTGLTGEQGVIVPQANVKNLMLREDVVQEVDRGNFHIYAVRTVDEGMAVLTGLEPGERHRDGSYPEGSINWRVNRRLRELAEGLQQFSSAGH